MLTYPTFLIPFCAWLLMGYFETVLCVHALAERVPGRADLSEQERDPQRAAGLRAGGVKG